MSFPPLDVLIVDDSLTVRMDLAEAFLSAGIATTLCMSVADARDALTTRRFGVVILDVRLPDGDGIDLLKELRARPESEHVPVMLLSTEAEVADRIRGLRTGADEYVGKPYDTAYVVARTRELAIRTAPSPSSSGGSGTSVLVIDDSTTYREELTRALRDAGYLVSTASTGEEGLRAAISCRPAVVIVDGVLPGIDGAAVIRRIREDAVLRRTPCVLLTASEERAGELRALEAGADAYVRKEADTEVVLLRLAALCRSTSVPAADSPPASSLGPKRILAVDDSITYLHELAGQLRAEGFEVATARSGDEALDLLSVQTPDCILLDLIMPGLSGRDTCRRIKGTPGWRDIPLMILSAQEERDAMIEGINAGADDYIPKASDFDVLKARLRAQLRRKQFEDENRLIRDELMRKEIEAADARAAKDASRVKSEFLAGMSHELRTPLNAIIGFTQLMHDGKAGPLSGEQEEYLGDVLTSARHLLLVINDVLDLAKVESGKMEFRPEAVCAAEVVTTVRDTVRTLASQKRITIDIDIDARISVVTIDPGRLRQVLYNYVSNALKFSPEDSRITVRVAPEGQRHWRLEVEDRGIGIAPDDMPKLFQEFRQLDAGLARRHEGTGLGLALTRHLVEAQGGRVGARSRPGEGSVFFAVFPR